MSSITNTNANTSFKDTLKYRWKCIKYCIKKHKMLLGGIIIYIIYAITFVGMRHYDAQRQEFDHVVDLLTVAAKSVSYILPQDFHKRILENYPTNLDDINIKRLTDYARENDIRFIYSFAKSGTNVIFTSASLSINNTFDDPEVRYGLVFSEASDKLRNAFNNLGRTFEEGTDRWGDFFAVYWTREEGGVKWVAGAELRKDIYEEHLNDAIVAAIQDLFTNSLAVIFIVLIAFYATKQKLIRLTEENKAQKRIITLLSRR